MYRWMGWYNGWDAVNDVDDGVFVMILHGDMYDDTYSS